MQSSFRRPGASNPSSGRLALAIVQLIGVAIVIFAAGIVLGFLVIGHHGGGPIQGWDSTVERWYVHNRGPLVGVSKFVATYLDALPLAVIAVVLTVILLAVRRSVAGLVPIVAYLGGEFQVYVIRHVILRHRPPTANYPAPNSIPGVHETSYSYPSGHAVAVTAVLFALLGYAALRYRTWWPWLIALVLSLFVIDTRLVLGVHWFSDVVFGMIFGVAWGVAVAVVGRRLEMSDQPVLASSWRDPRAT